MKYIRSPFPVASEPPVRSSRWRVPARRGDSPASGAAAPDGRWGGPAAAAPDGRGWPAPAAPASTATALASACPTDIAEGITGTVECVGITPVTPDVTSFELRAPWLTAADFEPGQYLTVRVPELGLERCYSISSAPLGVNTFTLTVKRVPGGAVSTYLHDVLRVGHVLHVDGPFGLFSTSFHPADQHLFVSAGSGITPIMSMVRALLARRTAHLLDIVLIHCASTSDDIVFRAELEQLAEVPGVTVVTMCSRESARAPRHGRISREILAEVAPDANARETFVCGPAGFMDTVGHLLAEAGVRQVHEESFVFATAPAQRFAQRRAGTGVMGGSGTGGGQAYLRAAAVGGRSDGVGSVASGGDAARFAIDFTTTGIRVDCDVETTVLEAALAAGITVPSSCETGMCGTCRSDLISGEVEMNHAGGIRPKEIAAGKFLPCCSTPLSDLVIGR